MAQGNLALAAALLKEIPKDIENPRDEIRINNNLGMIAMMQGQWQAALDAFQAALRDSEKYITKIQRERLRALQNIALVYELQGKEQMALQHYQENLAQVRTFHLTELEAPFLFQVGQAQLKQGDVRTALSNLEQAEALAQQRGDLETHWQAQTAIGQAQVLLGEPTAARKKFEQAIATVEKIRNQLNGTAQTFQNFLHNRLAPYHGLIKLLVQQRENWTALQYAQRAQGRVLLDLLRSGKRSAAKGLTPVEIQASQKAEHDLFSLNRELTMEQAQSQPNEAKLQQLKVKLETARNAQEALQNSLYAAHPELQWQHGELHSLSLTEISALIHDDQTAVLNYLTTEEKTWLFVLTKAKGPSETTPLNLQVYELPLSGKPLRERIEQFRRRIASRDFDLPSLAVPLYEELLAPAAAQLSGVRSLMIIPDGVLWNLPFQALQPARHSRQDAQQSRQSPDNL